MAEATGLAVDADLILCALTHRSFAYEHSGQEHNERLEFVGSAVVSLAVTEVLYRRNQQLAEDDLEKLRTAVVNMRATAGVARRFLPGGLGRYIRLGRGEAATGGRDKDSILAGALKAVAGAIYLQYGVGVASRVVAQLFEPSVAAAMRNSGGGPDWKTDLQELTARRRWGVPEYRVRDRGPRHERRFAASVTVGGVLVGEGDGGSKKQAQQSAARQAWVTLAAYDPDSGVSPTDGKVS
ncbi:ribonuclease III [Nocardia sp. N2S4-5]|uniref:ribonuclease III n=1 Tax=Nocardia sp. N2S4-5 TaxID=3351565 RepID=UPI0037D5F7D5